MNNLIKILLLAAWLEGLGGGKMTMALELSSPVIKAGEYIPEVFTCRGRDISPPLVWRRVPSGSVTLALTCTDPDAPVGIWTHWVIFNIPASLPGLEEEFSRRPVLPSGISQGMNDFREIGYMGPCPPPGRPHRYYFKLFALDRKLDLPPGVGRAQLEKAMPGHILGEAELLGLFQR